MPYLHALLLVAASLVLGVLALCELGLAYPVPGWLYGLVALGFVAGLVRPDRKSRARLRSVALAAVLGFIASLYWVEWTTRKPFLRDLQRIHPGMPVTEVQRIMGRYLEGTGWYAPPGTAGEPEPKSLRLAGSDRQLEARTQPTGELAIRDALVYRHSTNAAFNSDWGIVTLTNGHVARVEFNPD